MTNMKCVVIGDIGWGDFYHLGDEAMTEAALALLQERGMQVTLVAAQPEVSAEIYGVPTVNRIGFLGKWKRAEHEATLAQVSEILESGEPIGHSLYQAIAEADFVVIAGGGNLNSDHVQHLYERTAFTRIAKHYGKPLFITSQTVGPSLLEEDEVMLKEILDYTLCFGAREETTYKYVLGLTDHPEKVVHTIDDAAMLQINDDVRARVDAMNLPDRFIVASFTNHSGTVSENIETYQAQAAALLDELVARHDVDVVLVPHTGTFEPGTVTKDYLGHTKIVDKSSSGRLLALPMVMARDAIEITRRAQLSVSTRYHPTVFGPQVHTPTGSLSLSYYSSVRMRGSMKNLGLERFVVPATDWTLATDAFSELLHRSDRLSAHILTESKAAHAYQLLWWNALTTAAKTGTWTSPGNLPVAPTYTPEGDWSASVELMTPMFNRYSSQLAEIAKSRQREITQLTETVATLQGEVSQLNTEVSQLKTEREHLISRAEQSENRRAARLSDAAAGIFRKSR